MANGSLDEWIGKQVGVRFVPDGVGGDNRWVSGSCVLESADEKGIRVSFHDRELSQRHWFFPWHRVEGITLMPG